MKDWNSDDPTLKVLDVLDFMRLEIPPRELLLAPWLEAASLSMVYAGRGVGKTHFAMHLAHALATGGEFLKWRAGKPVPVLYVDGEMTAPAMQARWNPLFEAAGEPGQGFLRVVSRDLQPFAHLPNLASTDGQEALAGHFDEARVIILDNLSSLIHGAKENDAEGWEPVAQWAIRQRALGKALLFIHHAGKSGGQRGTSKREDLLDVVINLQRPTDYQAEQGARFLVQFEKARSLYGADVSPFEARLDGAAWELSEEDGEEQRLRELHAQGLTLAAIGAELGCDKSTVKRRLDRLRNAA